MINSQWYSSLIKALYVISVLSLILACSKNKEYLPAEIFNYNLVRKLKGKEAKLYLDRLHQKEVSPNKNEVGFYIRKNSSAEIYITHYDENKTANDDYRAMTLKICSDSSVFYNCNEFTHTDKTIFKCYGLNKVHFVFVERKNLFWLSVDDSNAESLLYNYLKYIQ